MRLRYAFILIVSLFVLSLVVYFTGVDKKFENVDIPLHLLGGFGWGIVASELIVKAGKNNQPNWFNFLFVVGTVLLVGTLWEFYEFAVRHWFGPQTWPDTLGDELNDILGATVAWLFFVKNK